MTEGAVDLARVYGACDWCPYRSILASKVDNQELDGLMADNAEIQDEPCNSVKDGECKVARYALEQLVSNK